MTVLEITHSLTEPEIAARKRMLEPKLEDITNYTYHHHPKLIKPMLSFDAAAMALSFVPTITQDTSEANNYTYHHLRRDVFDLCSSTGVKVDSRYVLPSAHLTVARFVEAQDTTMSTGGILRVSDPAKMKDLVACIDNINLWLRDTYWTKEPSKSPPGAQWIVGEEKGLDCQKGTLWYGNGERVLLGKGF